ncbi:MAG: 2-amino-4-ketopentanoate thiolase [Haloplasmataceae bacterium]|jgi:hypothetical protein|nr:2-amino-4-ketopentanoate thiolase [Haloplasmataceae bacterium]
MINAGSYVQIHKIILHPLERSAQVPMDTKAVPLEMFVKGFLLNDADLNDFVQIKTVTNRMEQGTLINITPNHKHNFGDFVPEVVQLSKMIKAFMDGDDC